jgi:hypothetical protein
MDPEAIKRETTLGHQRAEDYIALYNRIYTELVDLNALEKLEQFEALQKRVEELFMVLLNGNVSDPHFSEIEPLAIDDDFNRRFLNRTVCIEGYGRFGIRAQYEKGAYGEEEFAYGSVEHQPDLSALAVPAIPNTFVATYVGYRYDNSKEHILSDTHQENTLALIAFADLYDCVETIENLCREAGFSLPDNL